MRYAFLTTLIPPHMYEKIAKYSRYNMQDAASALQWHLYDGFSFNLNEKITIFNVLPVGSFPQYYSLPFIKEFTFFTKDANKHYNIGFCNIKLYRIFNQGRQIYVHLNKWCSENDAPKTLFVYTMSAQFMGALDKLKKKYPTLKICAIVADLPNMSNLSSKRNVAEKFFHKLLNPNPYENIGVIDSFVLLTKQMAEYMDITKPFIVMEGIATEQEEKNKIVLSDNIKRILYTGTLHRKFGMLTLLDAFGKIKKDNYKLIICGIGDSEDEIKEAAKEDSRIDFKGQLSRDEVLKLQKEATVLVNPRQNNEEFTKYSFPSKTMEYLSSGVPVIAYKLDGIPDEYDEYLNYVEDNSPKALADKIIELCEKSDEERSVIGRKGQAFVLENKNERVQTKRIVSFLENI